MRSRILQKQTHLCATHDVNYDSANASLDPVNVLTYQSSKYIMTKKGGAPFGQSTSGIIENQVLERNKLFRTAKFVLSNMLASCRLRPTLMKAQRKLNLQSFDNSSGLIRIGDRLSLFNLSYGQRHSIILPRDHHIFFTTHTLAVIILYSSYISLRSNTGQLTIEEA
uniref:Uncharacterized protein n=1 Tax=Vespula pensylvanica TaxID=30213 RepID=A0A834K0W0_VESPE|nr:hypothetical protein H0235_016327 [Vespula pensylvanica]